MNYFARLVNTLTLIAFAFTAPVYARWADRFRLEDYDDTRAAWEEAKSRDAVTEVLHAWRGYDFWDTPWSDGTTARNNNPARDVTDQIKQNLASNGTFLHIPGTTIESTFPNTNGQVTGIIYRDKYGVHFRRFEHKTSVRLPMITTWNHYTAQRHNGHGGYIYHHQFEEIGRGLITFTARGDHYLRMKLLPRIGTDATRWKDYSPSLGLDMSAPQESAGTVGVLNVDWGKKGHRDTVMSTYRNKGVDYYDHNGLKQHSGGGSNIAPEWNELPYPNRGQSTQWFMAIDKGRMWIGHGGTPTSKDELTADGLNVFDKITNAIHPFLRHIFLGNKGYKDYDDNMSRNILFSSFRSHVLDPAHKFETPPHLMGKFCFWREPWILPETDRGAITFKARGDSINIGFHTGPLDATTGYNTPTYHVRATGTCVIRKNGTDQQTTVHDTQVLGGSDKEVYYDYWVSYDRGHIKFGRGTQVGQSLVTEFIDSSPARDIKRFSFSSDMHPVDYIDINTQNYYERIEASEVAGEFATWRSNNKLMTPDLGGIIFSARNASANVSDRSLRIGLRDDITDQQGPAVYEVAWGVDSNEAGAITKLNSRVKQQRATKPDGTALGGVPVDDQWHDYWISFANGALAYGTGRTIGQNTIDTWRDAPPETGIQYFSFAAGDTTTEFRDVDVVGVSDQINYTTGSSHRFAYKSWQPAWQISPANKGGYTFTAKTDGVFQTGLAVQGSATAGVADYDIVVNDNGKVYIKKSRLKQDDSEVSLSAEQQPVPTGRAYWVLFNEGTIVFGLGSKDDIGKPDNVILTWEDADFNPAQKSITRYSFTSNASAVTFEEINTVPFSSFKDRIEALESALSTREETLRKWQENPSAQTISSEYARRFYWHAERELPRQDKGTFTCKFKKLDREPGTILIGLGTELEPASINDELSGAAYTLELKEDGTLILYKGTQQVTTSSHDELKVIGDDRTHSLWFNYDNGAFALGIDAATGSNPVWRYTDSSPTPEVKYLAVGADQALMQYTDMTLQEFYDSTQYETNENLEYLWRSEWAFGQANKGTMTWDIKNTDSADRPFIFAIGMAGSNQPDQQTGYYAGALYNILVDYSGQVYVRKKGAISNKVGVKRYTDSVSPSNDDLAKDAKLKSLGDGNTHSCWLVYEKGESAGSFTMGIDSAVGTDPVWSWDDTTPFEDVKHFSFASFNSVLSVTNIASEAATAVRSFERDFARLDYLLATDPNEVVTRLSNSVFHMAHQENMPLFISTVQRIVDNREIFDEDQRNSIIDSLRYVSHSEITKAIETLNAPLPLENLVNKYGSQIPAILELETNDDARLLFFRKLTALSDLPAEEMQTVGILDGIRTHIIEKFEDAQLDPVEQAVINKLVVRASSEHAILHSKDPDYLLDNLPELADLVIRISTIDAILKARIANTENKEDQMQLNDAQIIKLLGRLQELVDNRDELSPSGLAKLEATVKNANITPGIIDNTAHRATTAAMLDALPNPVEFEVILEKMTRADDGSLQKIAGKPFDDLERQRFFISLGLLFKAPGNRPKELLEKVKNDVITPLTRIPLSPAEQLIVQLVTTQTEQLLETTNLLAQSQDVGYILTNLATVPSADERVTIIRTLIEKQIAEPEEQIIKAEHREGVLNALKTLVANRDELSGKDYLEQTLRRAYATPGITGTKTINRQYLAEIGAALDKLKEPVEFGYVLNKMVDPASGMMVTQIIAKPQGDAQRARFFSSLSSLLTADGNKPKSLLDQLETSVLQELQRTILSPGEQAIVTQTQTLLEKLRDGNDLLALSSDPTYILANLATLETFEDRIKTVRGLLKLQIDSSDQEIINRQQQEQLLEALDVIVENRDELSDQGEEDLLNLLRMVNGTPGFTGIDDHHVQYRAKIVELLTEAEEEVEFGPRLAKLIQRVNLVVPQDSDEASRTAFFTGLEKLLDAPGEKTNDQVEQVETDLLQVLERSLLSSSEKATVNQVRAGLELLRNANSSFKSHLAIAQATQRTLYNYAQELSSIFYKKATSVSFADDDYAGFVNELRYLVKNRELLQANEVNFVTTLVRNTQISSEFSGLARELDELHKESSTTHEFESRVTYAQSEMEKLFPNATSTPDGSATSPYKLEEGNHFLNRFVDKLKLILDAPGMKTDKQFAVLESQILMPFGGSEELSEEHKAVVTNILSSLRQQKEQLLAAQKTFKYHFELAQEHKANITMYLNEIEKILLLIQDHEQQEHLPEIVFSNGDDQRLVSALEELVAERDAFNATQNNQDNQFESNQLVRTIKYAQTMKGMLNSPLRPRLDQLAQQAQEEVPFALRVTKYVDQVNKIIFMASDDPVRARFFTQLANLETSQEQERTEELLELLETKVLNILAATRTDANEQEILGKLEQFIAGSSVSARTISAQITRAGADHEDLYEYARAIDSIIRNKGRKYRVQAGDDALLISALQYIVDNRSLLNAEQLKEMQNMTERLISRGSFPQHTTVLTAMQEELQEVYEFEDRLNNCEQELSNIFDRSKVNEKISSLQDKLDKNYISPVAFNQEVSEIEDEWEQEVEERSHSNRLKRVVTQLSTIMDAPGKKSHLFNELDNLIADLLELPLLSKQRIAIEQLRNSFSNEAKEIIRTKEQTFTYHYDQAKEHKDNLATYVSALYKIVENKRLGEVTFAPRDYESFYNALAAVTEFRDAMDKGENGTLKTLTKAINYAYYSAGFEYYKEKLGQLYALASTEVTFGDRVKQYYNMKDEILALNPDDYRRQRFFSKLAKLEENTSSRRLDDLELLEELVTKVRDVPLNDEEEAQVKRVQSFVLSAKATASTLLYNIQLLLEDMTAAQSDPEKDYIDVMIKGLNDIVDKRNNQDITFKTDDYRKVVDLAGSLVHDRELFNSSQLGEVQSLIRRLQYGSGFESFAQTFDSLFNTAGTPLSFEERIEKYIKRWSEISNSAPDDPSKNQFVQMVGTIFNAPGERTEALLERLRSHIVVPIVNGAFSDDQKRFVQPLQDTIEFELAQLNSFEHRFEQAQTSVTPEAFHTSIESILNDYDKDSNEPTALKLTAANYTTLVETLKEEVNTRPIIVASTSKLAYVVPLLQQKLAAETTFSNATLMSTVNKMVTDMTTAADIVSRADYFVNSATDMLSKDVEDGARHRFFSLMSRYSGNLSVLTSTELTATIRTSLGARVLNIGSKISSGSATENERSIMTRLQTALKTASEVQEDSVVRANTTTTISNSNVVQKSSNVAANVVRSRFYAAPVVRYGR